MTAVTGRRPVIAGNWKMHTTIAQAEELAAAVAKTAAAVDRDVILAPPFTALAAVAAVTAASGVFVAGQNVHWEEKGAFTGEISPAMLRDAGASHAIVGHSERRQLFGETDGMVNRRLRGALVGGIIPIFCIGETLEAREAGSTYSVLERQLREGLSGVEAGDGGKVVVAYEPVWAIGTGRTATTSQAQDVHAFLRAVLVALFEKDIADHMRLLYGGSVKSENIDALMAQPDIDGVLVGGAALDAAGFSRIIKFC